jgi:aspartyl-tRNA(Asn)/glutamyl-tRNA(Gln) amidotransferase subunit B
MRSYVGLEIHIQVKTASKMFCRCNADYFSKEPNINTCPVCFGLPGALPVPNKAAFEKAVKLSLALNCSINQSTKFDRKNYFYPDLPKGYQISQYDKPIGYEGYVEIEKDGDSKRIRIQRVHLEEDTGKSTHAEGGSDETYLDYNKSGVPLVEVVTYPDFENEEEVILFAKRLRQIVRYLDVSDAEMQKGQMRYELNISTSLEELPAGQFPNFKVEVKNIGSISVLEKVLHGEIERQLELLKKGEVIKPHTRGLKDMSGETVFQRAKETADDYRYFPEPDIPPIQITNEMLENIRSQIKELPHQRKQRYLGLGLENEQSDILVEDTERGDWFDLLLNDSNVDQDNRVVVKEYAKWLLGDISFWLEKLKRSIKEMPLKNSDLIYLVRMMQEKKISGTISKQVLEEIFENEGEYMSAEQIVVSRDLLQIQDEGAVDNFVDEAIAANPKIVEDIKKNPNAIKFLVGQVMKLSKGKVNPSVAEEKLKNKLNI